MYYIRVMGRCVEAVEAQVRHCRFRIVLYINKGDISSPEYMQLGVF